jgi:perosamine synthetase
MRPEKKYWHEILGFNYRMTNLQAAVGVAQLRKLDLLVERKREIARIYNELLSGTRGITTHPEMPWARNVYWMYSILVDANKYGMSRGDLMAKLTEKNVETRPFFYPLHVMPVYDSLAKKTNERFPVTDQLSNSGINLPSGPKISDEDVEQVANLVKSFARRR